MMPTPDDETLRRWLSEADDDRRSVANQSSAEGRGLTDGVARLFAALITVDVVGADALCLHHGNGQSLLGTLPAEALATLVAKKLLDRDPPDTQPAWSAPWGRGFPQIEIEHEQAQAAS